MNFSYIIKALFISFFIFMIIFAITFVSTQKQMVDSSNYGVKDSVKESINIAEYRRSGDIVLDKDTLIKTTILNYIKNNNISVDDVTFEIYVDEVNNIVTTKIFTNKEMFESNSKSNYTFSYKVEERSS